MSESRKYPTRSHSEMQDAASGIERSYENIRTAWLRFDKMCFHV